MSLLLFFIYTALTLFILYQGLRSEIWELITIAYLVTATFVIGLPWLSIVVLWPLLIGIIAAIRIKPFNNWWFEKIYTKAIKSIPQLSKTEEEALNAGDTWFEKNLFTGDPNWKTLQTIHSELTPEEQAFIDNEVATLCGLLDDWAIHQSNDLPENVWTFLKEKGFFGLVIAKEYGGKGFSARAHSDIIIKVASRSGVAAVTVMVPNSLGPGELLYYYGTDEQKNKYLPSLAKGIEIPCFALTEPGAGSDATALQTKALVIEKLIDGKKQLGLLINNLNKRWITLAPVATLIGLAVNLEDPDNLLQGVGQEGITCLLIPRDTENLEIGNRHLPADQPFMNGSIRGENIFVPIDSIIGGQAQAGHGWQMLVECLSIGRSISLPALATASSSVAYLTSGAFSRVRKQFNIEIAQFEGIEEKLAEIAGLSYIINATRLLTLPAVNEHKKPSVASAITKHFNTELARITVNSGIDVHGGRTVVMGPRNYLISAYTALPISITVEGANILMRSLLIFGQGSIACHPFIREEFYAISKKDKPGFKKLLMSHIGYFLRNMSRTLCTAFTGGWFIKAPRNPLHREYQKITRLSYAFAFIADVALIFLGGSLKRKERLSARLADAISFLYMATAVIRYCEEQGMQADDQIHAKWAITYCLYQTQHALRQMCSNFPSSLLGTLLSRIAFPLGQTMHYPSDKMDHQLAQLMSAPNHYRDTIKQRLYLSGNPEDALDKMEHAFELIQKSLPIWPKIRDLKGYSFKSLKDKIKEKVTEQVLTPAEADALIEAERARWDAIQVDEFNFDDMKNKIYSSLSNSFKNPLD